MYARAFTNTPVFTLSGVIGFAFGLRSSAFFICASAIAGVTGSRQPASALAPPRTSSSVKVPTPMVKSSMSSRE